MCKVLLAQSIALTTRNQPHRRGEIGREHRQQCAQDEDKNLQKHRCYTYLLSPFAPRIPSVFLHQLDIFKSVFFQLHCKLLLNFLSSIQRHPSLALVVDPRQSPAHSLLNIVFKFQAVASVPLHTSFVLQKCSALCTPRRRSWHVGPSRIDIL